MSLGRKVKLNTGAEIPQLGYGTWQSSPGEVSLGVYEALKVGYRHIDLAKVYGNQKEVAEGLKKAFAEIPGLKREDVFITSKLWNSQHHPDVVEAALDDCLQELGLDYLDLYLIHFPVSFKTGDNLFPLLESSPVPEGDVIIEDGISIVDTWKAMTALPKTKARAVGVSNFTVEQLDALIKGTGVVPAANQVERHPLLQSNDLVAYAKEKGIHLTAYSAFGNNMLDIPLLVARPEVKAIAESVSTRSGSPASAAQVILAWSQVGGHSVIPKSVTPSRIQENFKEVEITAEDIAAINALGAKPTRYNIPYIANKPRWDINIFGEPEEVPATHKVII